MKYNTIVFREGKDSVAIIDARVTNSDLLGHRKFLAALKRAITKWVKSTEEGKKAFEYSCEDFNVGDLSSYTDSPYLTYYLHEEGIHELEISAYASDSGNMNWNYDTPLCNADELEEMMDEAKDE